MWFLQNDESVTPERRKKFRLWGLPKDEYADNAHVPYEMYVREARRIVGRDSPPTRRTRGDAIQGMWNARSKR